MKFMKFPKTSLIFLVFTNYLSEANDGLCVEYLIFCRNEDSYFVNICILSDASGVCLNLGGLHGALPKLKHLDLDHL